MVCILCNNRNMHNTRKFKIPMFCTYTVTIIRLLLKLCPVRLILIYCERNRSNLTNGEKKFLSIPYTEP